MHFPLQEVFFKIFKHTLLKKNLLKCISKSTALFVKNMVCIHQIFKKTYSNLPKQFSHIPE